MQTINPLAHQEENEHEQGAETAGTPPPAPIAKYSRLYKSRQTIGKAKKKALKSLPKSPRKQMAVVRAISKEMGINVGNETDTCNAVHSLSLQEDVKNNVIHFYHENSYTMSGKADTITVCSVGQKYKKQIKFIFMNVEELYRMFQTDN